LPLDPEPRFGIKPFGRRFERRCFDDQSGVRVRNSVEDDNFLNSIRREK
jgi:hypothetical protein